MSNMLDKDEHLFIMVERGQDVPVLYQSDVVTGKKRKELVKEWMNCLLAESESYIRELQSMDYNVKSKSDLMTLARELEYYKVNPGVYLVK